MRNIKLISKGGFLKIRAIKGFRGIAQLQETFFDSYGSLPPKLLSDFITKRNRIFF